MKILVTVGATYQIGPDEYVTDRFSKIVTDETIYELIDWAFKQTGKKVSVNELMFSLMCEVSQP